jgi:hypothetical protein
MSSTLFVDAIEPNLSSGVHIAGHVIQVVNSTETSASSATSSSPVEVVSVNITPKSSNSKIHIIGSVNASVASDGRAAIGLYKDGSALVKGDSSGSRGTVYAQIQNDDTGLMGHADVLYLDSPNTTSEVTYSIYMEPEGGSTAFFINRSSSDNDSGSRFRGVSSITVMEIAQ